MLEVPARRDVEGKCEQRRLVAERGAAVEHLLADGTARTHAQIEEALLRKAGADLFDDRATLLAQAYDARERAMRGT